MGPFLLGVIVAVGIGIGASIALEGYQKSADMQYVGSGARPDPEPTLGGRPRT